MKGRRLYLRLAVASAKNARELLLDSRALRRRGSRGPSCALSILSIEEAAKAFLYKLAGEGVYRIVARRPNGISTFSEGQLFDHRFKHAVVAKLLATGIQYGPVQRVLRRKKRPTYSREELHLIVMEVLHEQQLQMMRLNRGGRAAAVLAKTFARLERFNDLKNSGFYVGSADGKVRTPNDVSLAELSEIQDLAEAVGQSVASLADAPISSPEKAFMVEAVREIAQSQMTAARVKTDMQHSPLGAPRAALRPPSPLELEKAASTSLAHRKHVSGK